MKPPKAKAIVFIVFAWLLAIAMAYIVFEKLIILFKS